MLNAYEFLNVREAAEAEEIKSAYRKISLLYHPDKNPGKVLAKGRFQLVKEALDDALKGNKERRYPVLGHYDPRIYVQCPKCKFVHDDGYEFCSNCMTPVSKGTDFPTRRRVWLWLRSTALSRWSNLGRAQRRYHELYGHDPVTRGRDLVE